MSRCSGHCCTVFPLPRTFAQIAESYRAFVSGERIDQNGHAVVYDIDRIALMVRPVPTPSPDALDSMFGPGWAKVDPASLSWYTCRHLLPSGDCAIYQDRPNMCRDYPYGQPCERVGCTLVDVEVPRLAELCRK